MERIKKVVSDSGFQCWQSEIKKNSVIVRDDQGLKIKEVRFSSEAELVQELMAIDLVGQLGYY